MLTQGCAQGQITPESMRQLSSMVGCEPGLRSFSWPCLPASNTGGGKKCIPGDWVLPCCCSPTGSCFSCLGSVLVKHQGCGETVGSPLLLTHTPGGHGRGLAEGSPVCTQTDTSPASTLDQACWCRACGSWVCTSWGKKGRGKWWGRLQTSHSADTQPGVEDTLNLWPALSYTSAANQPSPNLFLGSPH